GYTEREKLEIAKRHLVAKQLEANGLTTDQVDFTDDAITTIIQYYTREAGVRNLEREIASVLRKTARKVVAAGTDDRQAFRETVTGETVRQHLGPTKFRPQMMGETNEIGLAVGLAWTEVGGDVLNVEATLIPGRGRLTLTGKLGEVMQESAQAAITCVRSRASKLGISPDFYKKYDLHIHVPEGAIPKDGPSAGITLATAIVSALTRIPARKDVAMTGEITLRGKVLPIGGVKEKLLAAHRGGIRTIILPKENEKDIVEIPPDVLQEMEIHFVDMYDEVPPIALEERPSAVTVMPVLESAESTPDGVIAPVWKQDPSSKGPASTQISD